jgi:hypothetical protein
VQPHPDGRAAHADLRREIALGRQAIAGAQTAALDQVADEGHDLIRAAFSGAICAPTGAPTCAPTGGSAGAPASGMHAHHKWSIQSYTPVAVRDQNVNRRPSWMSRGLLRSWFVIPNVALRGLTSGFQSTV